MALAKANQIVSSNPVVVFRWVFHDHDYIKAIKQREVHEFMIPCKTYCGYCKDVKDLLSRLQATYKVIELNEESDGDDIQVALLEWTGQRTVPNVFIGGKHIGGSDVVLEKHQQSKLVPLLEEAGAVPKQSTI